MMRPSPRTSADASPPGGASPHARGGLPAARPTSHLPNFVWWLAVGFLVFAGFFSQRVYVQLHHHAPPPPGREREAFLALSFGKICDFGEEFMPSGAFADVLNALLGDGC